MNIKYALILSFLSGISTMVGTIFVFKRINDKKINKYLSFFLSLSASIMVMISITELIPKSLIFFYYKHKWYVIVLTIVISILINKIINKNEENTLYQVGILSCITIFLHNVPEGIITFLSSSHNLHLGIRLSLSIAIHNIPEGIIVAMPIYFATKSKIKAFKYTLISSLAEPMGALLTYLFLYKYITNTHLYILFLITGLLMINIAINSIFPESLRYHTSQNVVGGVLLGIILSIVLLFI